MKDRGTLNVSQPIRSHLGNDDIRSLKADLNLVIDDLNKRLKEIELALKDTYVFYKRDPAEADFSLTKGNLATTAGELKELDLGPLFVNDNPKMVKFRVELRGNTSNLYLALYPFENPSGNNCGYVNTPGSTITTISEFDIPMTKDKKIYYNLLPGTYYICNINVLGWWE
jgi:hypothetical protein